jgi:hypothetical protein
MEIPNRHASWTRKMETAVKSYKIVANSFTALDSLV